MGRKPKEQVGATLEMMSPLETEPGEFAASTAVGPAPWQSEIDTTAPLEPEKILASNGDAPLECLVVIAGPEIGKRIQLAEHRVTIGRVADNDIQIDQENISRHHAVINRGESGRFVLADLGSTNGTFVNDKRINTRELRDGDLLRVGQAIFKCLAGQNIEAVYHDELYRLSTLDPLTQIHNKRSFLETMEKEVSRSRRYARALSLLMIDIDHFKKVNDLRGHLAGDHVLKELAATILARIRKEDTFARYGGEELAIILPETDRAHALGAAEKIRSVVEQHHFFFEAVIPLTVSIGVATLQDEATPEELIRRADAKLYEAKRRGRNRVEG